MSQDARPPMSAARRSAIVATLGAAWLALWAGVLAGLATAPIYRSASAWIVALVAAGVAFGLVWLGRRFRWGPLTVVALIVAFVLLVVPLAVPSALTGGLGGVVRGLGDGLASVALGWKQLLTLTLPVGSYQTVLVPLFVVVFGATALSVWLALRGGIAAQFASLPVALPVAFGTVFGSSSVSDPLQLGPLQILAPREIAIWLLAFGVIAGWIAWASGTARRAALRRGRDGSSRAPARRRGALRGLTGAGIVVVALAVGSLLAPALTTEARSVPRDRIDPEIVIAERTSPLAAYRTWKRDAQFAAALFDVTAEGELPARIRLAVMDRYDGVDFTVGTGSGSVRFTRFPSGEPVAESSRVSVRIEEGYSDIWVPLAMPLASPPSFTGPRAAELGDSFYVNRDTLGAVAIPTKRGLEAGDGLTAEMSVAADARLGEQPAHEEALIDLEKMPELEQWWHSQELPATGQGYTEALDRLRNRGYLSHALTDGEGERKWLDVLGEQYGTRFVTSPGGHSIARVEQLFQQLNEQQRAAGKDADDETLVAGIGDDEQFAAAAALLAQAVGFDSRVVLGVRMGGAEVPGVPACAESCTGENIAAWVEVRGSDGVWAPFDVTPQVETPPTTLEEGEQLPEYPTVPEERDAEESEPPVGTSDADGEHRDPREAGDLAVLWVALKYVGLGLAALALITLLVLFIPVAKRIRRRARRTAPDPEIRALGAWDELLDAYVDSGSRVRRRAARTATAEDLAIPDGVWIASEVNRAVFSSESIDMAAADALWRRVDATTATQRAGLGRWGRLRARFSLASYGVPRLGALFGGREGENGSSSMFHGGNRAARGIAAYRRSTK